MRAPDEYYQSAQLEALRMGMRMSLNADFVNRIDVSEDASDMLYSLGRDVGFKFKTDIWADKVADETFTETQKHTFTFETEEFESAWQLWKHNHWTAWWFTYLGFLYFCSTPKRVKRTGTKTETAQLKFRVCKYHTFPDFNPETYPGQFGRYYRYVKQDKLAFNWMD